MLLLLMGQLLLHQPMPMLLLPAVLSVIIVIITYQPSLLASAGATSN
jgi:hypothetical protein